MKKHIKNTAIVIACVFAGSLYFGNAQRGGRQGDAEWLNFLAENGGDPRGELTAAKASELLFNGCNYTTPAIYDKLRKVSLDYEYQNLEKQTFLHQCQKGPLWEKIATEALKKIDINARDENGRTPWLFAVEKGNLEAATWLKNKGANIQATDNNGNNAWFVAHESLHDQLRLWNLDQSDFKNDELQNDLMYFLKNGKKKRAMLLLKGAPDLEMRDRKGRTALHYAAMQGNTEVVQMILNKNLDYAYVEDVNKKTPVDVANGGARSILLQYTRKGYSSSNYD